MKKLTIILCLLLPLGLQAQKTEKIFRPKIPQKSSIFVEQKKIRPYATIV